MGAELVNSAARRIGRRPEEAVSVETEGRDIFFKIPLEGLRGSLGAKHTYRLSPEGSGYRIYRARKVFRYMTAGCGSAAPYDTVYDDAGFIGPDGGDGGSERDGGPGACTPAPRNYEGDGHYDIRPGDKVAAANGVSFVLGSSGIDPEEGTDFFAADFYIGESRLNDHFIQFRSGWNYRVFGIEVGPVSIGETECGLALSADVRSRYAGPIESNQDLYAACLEGESHPSHEICSYFIPYEPAPSETIHKEGKFQAITLRGADPIIGSYYLGQLRLFYPRIVEMLGASEIAPAISLRWFIEGEADFSIGFTKKQIVLIYAGFLSEDDFIYYIRDLEVGGLASIAQNGIVGHELSHLIRDHMGMGHGLNEGLAEYTRYHALEDVEHAPALEAAVAFNTPIDIPRYPQPITFVDYDPANGEVLADFGVWFEEKTMWVLDERTMIAVDGITDQGVSIRVFKDESMDGWHTFSEASGWQMSDRPICMETGYTKPFGFYINGEAYPLARLEDGEPLPARPYIRLDDFPSPMDPDYLEKMSFFYDTAFCLFEGIRELYGHDVIREFVRRAEVVRRANVAGQFTAFCALSELKAAAGAAAGADIIDYLDRFLLSDECIISFESGNPYF